MKAFLEKLFALATDVSMYLIPAYALHKILVVARTKPGSDLEVTAYCFLLGLLICTLLYTLRYCIIQICYRLSPFVIDGDRLVRDYGIKFTKNPRDKYVNFTFDDGGGSDGVVTLITKTGSAFVENVVSSNSNLTVELSDLDWKVNNVSPAEPGEPSYIVKFGSDRLYLSEDQLLDLFSYLMARHYEDIIDEEMIDEEIEKYCTGLGLIPSAQ